MPGDADGKLPGNQEADGAIGTLDELLDRWGELDQRWNRYLDSLTDESLDEIVYKTSTSSGPGKRHGKRHGTTRSDVLIHVCTHAQYTTAQLINMLRQLGENDLPDVMLISLARQEQSSN